MASSFSIMIYVIVSIDLFIALTSLEFLHLELDYIVANFLVCVERLGVCVGVVLRTKFSAAYSAYSLACTGVIHTLHYV
jgi:hypothetical protein